MTRKYFPVKVALLISLGTELCGRSATGKKRGIRLNIGLGLFSYAADNTGLKEFKSILGEGSR